MGGESYITFKPDLIDGDDRISDNSTKAFLQDFVDQLTALVERVARRPDVADAAPPSARTTETLSAAAR
jgi:hypothetical protein